MRKVMRTVVFATSLALCLGSVAAAQAQPAPAVPTAQPSSGETFTLLTGDQVVWPSGDIKPAKGREDVVFSTHTVGGHTYVFPSDVVPQITSGKLDRRLFDLAALRSAGAHDARQFAPKPKPPPRLHTAEDTHSLTVDLLDRNGMPAQNFSGVLVDLDAEDEFPVEYFLEQSSSQLDLPAGRYLLDAQITTVTATGEEIARLFQPLIVLDRDTTITVDSRVAQPIDITVPEASAELAAGQIYVRRFVDGVSEYGGGLWLSSLHNVFTAQIGPDVPAEELEVYVDAQWAKPSGLPEYELRFLNTPYVYALMWREPEFPTGLSRTVTDAELATVSSQQFASGAGTRSSFELRGYGGDGGRTVPGQYRFDLPATVALHVSPGDVYWDATLFELAPPFDTGPNTVLNMLSGAGRSYTAGGSYRETWNSGVLGPRFLDWLRPSPDYEEPQVWPWFARKGDLMAVGAPMLADSTGNGHYWEPLGGVTNLRTALYRDGELISELPWFGHINAYVDPAPAAYRLESSLERPLASVSTKVSAAWTFPSGHVSEGVAALPVSTIGFAPAVDMDNKLTWKPEYVVPVTVQRQAGSAAGPVKTLTVDVSVDDGQTWTRTRLIRVTQTRWLAVVRTPAASHVSLRASSTDTAGNTVEQTITRAYGLK
jgi:hypothetical protein